MELFRDGKERSKDKDRGKDLADKREDAVERSREKRTKDRRDDRDERGYPVKVKNHFAQTITLILTIDLILMGVGVHFTART